jgi:hypothetical protein
MEMLKLPYALTMNLLLTRCGHRTGETGRPDESRRALGFSYPAPCHLTCTHCIQIQGKNFVTVRWRAHPGEWKKIEGTVLLNNLGEGKAFTPMPFYSKEAIRGARCRPPSCSAIELWRCP